MSTEAYEYFWVLINDRIGDLEMEQPAEGSLKEQELQKAYRIRSELS